MTRLGPHGVLMGGLRSFLSKHPGLKLEGPLEYQCRTLIAASVGDRKERQEAGVDQKR